ncbi:MAG TPA: ornithine cyclodeaminase family protein [Thermoanaerobaculia bacterium]|nr:ornithine cyclodeaminase family protein [Thermoanaerobaculia bacterium]
MREEPETLVVTRAEVARLLSPRDCRLALEEALLRQAAGHVIPPGVLTLHLDEGGLHVKAAGLAGAGRVWVAAKCNANIPGNPERRSLPTIQGVIALFDGRTGSVLALLDSIEVTLLRTAAATAVAARHLAVPDASLATIVGCGSQAPAQLRALCEVLPLARVNAYDWREEQAAAFARTMCAEMEIDVIAVPDLTLATRESQVVVTCTPSRAAFLGREQVSPGTFVAAVGADHPEKSEIAPGLMAASRVVVDVLSQCEAMGDLHHAIAAGVMSRDAVHAELHEVVAGTKSGRVDSEEVVVFDSTGSALADVAAAALVYERALASNAGRKIDLQGGPW